VRVRKRLGDMLVEAGLLSNEQLMAALAEQKKQNLKLGQFLIREGIIREESVVELLSSQLRIEQYDPEKYPVDSALASYVPAHIAQKHQIAPLAKKRYYLVIAMVDPMDINALEVVEGLVDLDIEPVICSERNLNQILGSIYGISAGITGNDNVDEQIKIGPIENDEEEDLLQVSSLLNMAEGASVVRMVNWIIGEAVKENASDVHISPERNSVQLRFRIDGVLQEVPSPPKSLLLPIISRLKILGHMDISLSRVPQDGRFSIHIGNKEINIRVSMIPTINGENVVLRLLDMSMDAFSLEAIGMQDAECKKIENVIAKPYGMILSTGPTGSGKTTTLYALLKKLNQPEVNIITVEDPVEYRIKNIRQIQLNHKAGMTFAGALRSILRQDPDIIMVGEIRDVDTAQIAVQAALTGHLVLSTVHTNDAAGAITRLIEMGVQPFIVGAVLLASIAQRLVRKLCDRCAVSWQPSEQLLQNWELTNKQPANYRKYVGCNYCMHTGYKGRTGIYELLIIDDEFKNMILQGATATDILKVAMTKSKIKTLKSDVAHKLQTGITSIEEASSAVMI